MNLEEQLIKERKAARAARPVGDTSKPRTECGSMNEEQYKLVDAHRMPNGKQRAVLDNLRGGMHAPARTAGV
ncbi:hypothetical protein ABZ348_26465 [Streptomyces sp. NPDC005963]|uniref:hypothetical protein n=1 Tax=Streptomyces sp. NPDC005963 TaxID=3156721 RepID=UPI0033F23A06